MTVNRPHRDSASLRATAACAVLCIVAVVSPRDQARGADGIALMKIEPGARPAGLGGAFVSITGGPSGVPYNPASVTTATNFAASFSHTGYWENIRIENAFFATPLKGSFFACGGIRYATVGNLEMRQSPVDLPEAYFEANDLSFKAGVAYRFTHKLSAGVTGGMFIEKIEGWRGSTPNFDVGLLYKPKESLTLGTSVTNLGPAFYLNKPGQQRSRKITLPRTWRVGCSYGYDRYLGAADLVVLDQKAHVHLGLEGRLHEMLSVRAGFMSGYDTKNFTAGASFSRRGIVVDYAFIPYSSSLGSSHLFSFTFQL